MECLIRSSSGLPVDFVCAQSVARKWSLFVLEARVVVRSVVASYTKLFTSAAHNRDARVIADIVLSSMVIEVLIEPPSGSRESKILRSLWSQFLYKFCS